MKGKGSNNSTAPKSTAPKKDVRNYKLDHKLKIRQDDPLYYILENDLDLKSNHIYLFGIEAYTYGGGIDAAYEPGVEYVMANRFIRNLNLCMRVNPETPLVIHMKTCGGDWTEGMAIYDAIRSFPWPVTILNYTHARSMSSLIMQGGNKRVMMPNSYFMFHDGTFGMEGTVKQVRSAVKFEENASETMLEIYAKVMKYHGKMSMKKVEEIKKWLRNKMDKEEDVYLSAKEAVEFGFADEIFDADWSKLTEYTEQQLTR
jgi:ATP-dependent Clp protease protease subunit